MKNRNGKIPNNPRNGKCFCAIFLLCAFISIFCENGFAQSQRHRMAGTLGKVAPSPSLTRYAQSLPEKDIDLFFGKIIMIEKDTAYVYITSPTKIPSRIPLYYACDVKMRPTSILTPTGIRHKACAVFKIETGTAVVGDVVMVKYLAPKNESDSKKSADIKSAETNPPEADSEN